jgi:DNA-binding NarL/FixJ family response regulator
LDDAVRHFEQAIALHARLRARPLLAHTRYRWATTLFARGAAGDRERSQELGKQALETAQTLGMPLLAEQAARLTEAKDLAMAAAPAEGIRPTNSLPTAGREVLTPREIEVLGLLAGGATNAQIAETLALTVGTVRWYTIRIYQKIDARGRPDAVAYALRHGLTRGTGADL